jgi:hypothetical protein
LVVVLFFFFKQKTAYEIVSGDWSADVCSSDLPAGMLAPGQHGMSGPVVVGHLAAGDQLGLTVEPAAGAARPTSAPIVLVALDR